MLGRLLYAFCIGRVVLIGGALSFVPSTASSSDFLTDFAQPLIKEGGLGDEKAFDLELADDGSLLDNLKKLFYPDSTGGSSGGALWELIRNIAVGLLVLLFIRVGARMIFYADDEDEIKRALMNLLYLVIGALLLFFVVWFLGDALNLSNVEGLSGGDESLTKRLENNVLLVLLGLLKGIAFFAAIVFIVYYGYQMISAFSAEEKLKAARTGIFNVLIALIFIKVIDYIYFIALQGDFKDKAVDFVVGASKFLGYIAGFIMVIALIYAGYMMVTANGNEEQAKKARNLVKGVFVTIVILLLFMLIIYQIFQEVV